MDDDGTSNLGWLPLTRNLHNAVKNLGNSVNITPKVFWINQISINQADNKEKGHQVENMHPIYPQALRVITYIGPEEANDKDALKYFLEVHKTFEPYYWKPEVDIAL